jgi:hypothetical protein
MANENNETLYPQHNNGNPLHSNKEPIALWEKDESDLRHFIDRCEQIGVTFVATEWGLPDVKLINNDPRTVLITIIREPLSRFISNYKFSYYNHFTDTITIDQYIDCLGLHTSFNYYTRIFSGTDSHNEPVNNEQYRAATLALDNFDIVQPLEENKPHKKIANYLEWKATTSKHQNSTSLTMRHMAHRLKNGDLKYLYRRFLGQKPKINRESFKKYFIEENMWDLRLYNYIR